MRLRSFEVDGSFCCLVEGQLVCLDLQNDRYFGLSRDDTDRLFGPHLSDAERCGAIEAVCRVATGGAPSAPSSCIHGISERFCSGLISLGCQTRIRWLQVLLAQTVAAAKIRSFPIDQILMACRPPGLPDAPDRIEGDAARLTVQYSRLARWSPLRGECFFHSVAVQLFLTMNQLASEITFGVRAQPFAAHCWIRGVGNPAFGDQEDITTFEPIMQAQVRT